tara:strand:+ start:806 stop:1987 length:1182 start_codon:yes stop_codon:yes gene_type:complete
MVIDSSLVAFDNSFHINHIYLNQENFLDIKSYQFTKLDDEIWYEKGNGWRLSGGSLGLDLLYTNLEARIKSPLSKEVSIIFSTKQEEFYEIKPFRYLVEIEWKVFDGISFSILGMPEYDKRKADQGMSISIGESPWNFLHFRKLLQDLHYNEKNFYDDSYYNSHPVENFVEGAFRWKKWRTRFSFLEDKKFSKIFPNEGFIFSYEGKDYKTLIDYYFGKRSMTGLLWRYFDIFKVRESNKTTTILKENNRKQRLHYSFIDYYWLYPLNTNFHITIGLREDKFTNYFRQLEMTKENYDFFLWTFQIYGILRHEIRTDRYWEYALYTGDTEKAKNFITDENKDERKRKYESKMRVSWEIKNLKKESSLMLTSTWNLDNFFNDFWDGGNIKYQKTF